MDQPPRTTPAATEPRAEFWREHGHAVRHWLWMRWCHSPLRTLVDDATQEVFLELVRPGGALEHLDPTRAPRGVAAWLRSIVHHVACRIERARARDHARLQEYTTESAATAGVGEAADQACAKSWEHDQVVEALDLVAATERTRSGRHGLRELLHLHFELGMPVHEIAATWNEPPEHVHELRRRACQRFRECLLRVMHHRPGPELPRAHGQRA